MSEACKFWLNWGAQLAIATGTIGAVVVALFGNWIRNKLVPPKLEISMERPLGIEVPTILTSPNGDQREAKSRWYHMSVKNLRRWSPATQVQVFLTQVEKPDAAGEAKSIWVGEIPLKWRHQEIHPLARTIGYHAEIDLCSVVEGKWLEIHPLVAPAELQTRYKEQCVIFLSLQARSVESDSEVVRVKIAWDGQWSDDTENMNLHMVVKIDETRN